MKRENYIIEYRKKSGVAVIFLIGAEVFESLTYLLDRVGEKFLEAQKVEYRKDPFPRYTFSIDGENVLLAAGPGLVYGEIESPLQELSDSTTGPCPLTGTYEDCDVGDGPCEDCPEPEKRKKGSPAPPPKKEKTDGGCKCAGCEPDPTLKHDIYEFVKEHDTPDYESVRIAFQNELKKFAFEDFVKGAERRRELRNTRSGLVLLKAGEEFLESVKVSSPPEDDEDVYEKNVEDICSTMNLLRPADERAMGCAILDEIIRDGADITRTEFTIRLRDYFQDGTLERGWEMFGDLVNEEYVSMQDGKMVLVHIIDEDIAEQVENMAQERNLATLDEEREEELMREDEEKSEPSKKSVSDMADMFG